jgi:hypothetical protein
VGKQLILFLNFPKNPLILSKPNNENNLSVVLFSNKLVAVLGNFDIFEVKICGSIIGKFHKLDCLAGDTQGCPQLTVGPIGKQRTVHSLQYLGPAGKHAGLFAAQSRSSRGTHGCSQLTLGPKGKHGAFYSSQ